MFKRSLLLLTAMSFSNISFAQQTQNLEISIYNDNLALVKDARNFQLNKGKNSIIFEGVASQIIPESVMINGNNISVLEQNYDYDLITPQNMIEKSVGAEVKTVITNPKNGENIFNKAKIVSANYGNPVLEFDYGIETNFPGRIVFETLPENLQIKPTLKAKINSAEDESNNLSLAYLTNGISWNTNYVAEITDSHHMNLTGWVTINNQSGTDYKDAQIQLIAGDVHRVASARPMMMNTRMMKAAMVESVTADMAAGVAAPQQISAYQLYTLPERTDIKNNQTKQISLIESPSVLFNQEGHIDSPLWIGGTQTSEFKNVHPSLYYNIENKEDSGLGLPLPSGTIRFYEKDEQQRLQFIGEASINHVAKGEEMKLSPGDMFNIFANGKISKVTKISENKKSTKNSCDNFEIVRQYDVEVTFNNGGNKEEKIIFAQNMNQNTKIIKTNLAGKSININRYEWEIEIPQESTFTLKYTAKATTDERRCQ